MDNMETETQTDNEVLETAGQLLSKKREDLGLSIDSIAEKLNLDPKLLELLEKDNYEEFTVETYLKGYLRAYARFLDIDADKVVNLYTEKNSLGLKKLHGKSLSYNNYNDIYAALNILKSLKKNHGTVIIKHANPCGVSSEKDQFKSFRQAFICDPVSAFGGIVAINSIVSKKLAIELNKTFFEVIISKGFNKGALKILKKRKNLRLIDSSQYHSASTKHYLFFENSFLVQDPNDVLLSKKIKIVTKKKPSISEIQSLKFAFNICKYVKSNAIVLVKDKSTIGIGSGQPSRLDSCEIASKKALNFVPEKIINSVAASDAFFPFPDGVQKLIKVGVKAIIQPGGSRNDKEIIKVANKAKIVMAFTGTRHFKH